MYMSCKLCGAPGVNIKTCPLNPHARAPDPSRHNKHVKDLELSNALGVSNSIDGHDGLDPGPESGPILPELLITISRMMDDHSFMQAAMVNKTLLLLEHQRFERIKAIVEAAVNLFRSNATNREILGYLYHLNGNTGSYNIEGIEVQEFDDTRIYSKNNYKITFSTTYTEWTKDDVRHRIDGPAYISNVYDRTHIWCINGEIWRDNDLPSQVDFYDNGKIKNRYWHKNNKLDRDNDLPAYIKYTDSGQVDAMVWYKDGNIHRDGDKPAYIVFFTGNNSYAYEIWYQHGQIHRDGGPARIIYTYQYPYTKYRVESQQWYNNGVKLP